MHRLLSPLSIVLLLLLLLLLIVSVRSEARSPKIYNVLISSKKNLSPSHALPVYEPVIRTTSLGVALPPVFYHTAAAAAAVPLAYQPLAAISPHYVLARDDLHPADGPAAKRRQDDAAPEPLPVGQFIPYGYLPQVVNPPSYYPGPEQPQTTAAPREYYQKPEDPKQLIANLKRNPEIPDVPPPAAPVSN